MKKLQGILVAMAAMISQSCVSTVSGPTVTGIEDAMDIQMDSVLPTDGEYDSGPDVALDSQTPPTPCTQDQDCQALVDTCNAAVCRNLLCTLVPTNAEAPCDDGDPCTINTHCNVGKCAGTQVCSAVPLLHPFYPLPPSPL